MFVALPVIGGEAVMTNFSLHGERIVDNYMLLSIEYSERAYKVLPLYKLLKLKCNLDSHVQL